MAFLSSVLPGVREVRAPLVAGYLWILFGWLLIDPATPDGRAEDPYNQLGKLGEAIGPVGKAVAVSVGAYLLGSLLISLTQRAIHIAQARRFQFQYQPQELSVHNLGENSTLQGVALLAGIGPGQGSLPGWRGYTAGAVPNPALDRAILALADRELGDERRVLEGEFDRARKIHKGDPPVQLLERGGAELVGFEVGLNSEVVAFREFVIPRFLAVRDLLLEIPILRTRLIEVTKTVGAEVERIYYEAEFRFAVAPPLVALIILFGTTSPIWLAGLVVPLALVFQGIELQQESDRQLLDALRARAGTPDLEQITPVFARYRKDATALSEGISKGNWIASVKSDS